MGKSLIWATHVRHIATALREMEKFTTVLNDNPPKDSELVFMVPDRVDIEMYGEQTQFALVLEDGAWYLEIDEEKEVK